jgi:hypothetical protein
MKWLRAICIDEQMQTALAIQRHLSIVSTEKKMTLSHLLKKMLQEGHFVSLNARLGATGHELIVRGSATRLTQAL